MQKFDAKLTCAFNNDIKNLANFHQRTRKSKNWDSDGILFIQSRKYISLKFRGELCVMPMKNDDAKFEEELTCQLKIDMWNLKNIDPNTQKSLSVYMFELKKYRSVMFDGAED